MKLKQISRRTVSVVLAVLMVLSTLLVGSISTVNAASQPSTIYFKPNSNWLTDSSSVRFAAFFYGTTDTWKDMTSVGDGIYSVENDGTNSSIIFVRMNGSTTENDWKNKWNQEGGDGKYAIPTDGTNLFTQNSGTGDTKGGTWSTYSGGGGETTLSCPTEVLNGTNVMFYVAGYTDSNASSVKTGLSNGNESDKKFISGTIIKDNDNGTRYAYVSVPGTDLTTYTFITHKVNDWVGYKNTSIPNAKGGELYYGNTGGETSSSKSRTTADVNLSSSSVEQGTSSISLTNTLSATTPAYGSDLYVMYYLYDGTNYTLLNSDTASTKVSSTSVPYTIDTSSLSAGSYTVKTVLTDSNVYYVADSDDFTVTEATKTYNINYGTFTNGNVTGPTSAKEGDTVQLTVTPAEGYKLSSITTGTTATVNVSDYTFTMPASDVTINATFTSETPTEKYSIHVRIADDYAVSSYTIGLWAWGNYDTNAYGYTDWNNMPTHTITDHDWHDYTFTNDVTSWKVIIRSGSPLSKQQEFNNSNNGYNSDLWVTVTGDNTYTVSTTAPATSNITIDTATVNGKISNVAPGTANIESGTTVTVTVAADEGYVCSNVTYNGTPATKVSDTVYTFAMPAEDVTVSATFEEKPPTPTKKYYYKGSQDSWVVHEMYPSADGTYYYYPLTTQNVQFLISESEDFSSFYNKDNVVKNYADTDISEVGNYGATNAYVWYANNGAQYYVRFYPDGNVICASTTVDADTNNFSVTMTQGISNFGGSLKGNSGFDKTSTSTTDVTQTFDRDNNLTVQFYTQMKDTFEYNGEQRYKFGVQGYSILMTTSEGTQVTSTVNVAHPSSGVYTASYTFPENIISATVTPVFTASEVYAESQGITFTTVYLRYQPNSGTTFRTYEPKYYTWRSNDSTASTTIIDGKEFENQPESGYPGQKLLYIGNNTYTVKVQSQIKGILFSYGNGDVQTFDYNEFLKLQELGYDNITFEIKEGSSETVAKAISDAFKGNGNTVYSTPGDVSGIVNDTNLSDEFFLDTNIEGYVIDVFGNKLLDTNGQPIRLTDLTGATNAAKLSELLEKMGKSTENGAITALYGARYGDGKIYGTEGSEGYGANTYYGMDYPIRVYYFNNLKQLISQQISGYGPIEGAASLEAGKTNREVYTFTWKYYEGTNASSVEKTFSSEFNVIPDDYKGVPYLVSYKTPLTTNKTRVAGKWYYQRDIAQFNVTVKPALMTNGVIDFDNPIGGSATVNGVETAVVNQGDTPTFEATNNTGYTFVGFYNADGSECYGTSNPFSGHKIANNETVYAVFKKLDVGTLKINNYVYQGTNLDPIPGGGTGNVSAKLYILRYDSDAKTYAADWKVYTNGEATINDMDKYYYVLSGTPLGADKFIAFRAKEVNEETGYVTYAKLDTLDGQPVYDESTNTYTYTSEQVVWDWETAVGTGEHTYTIDRYTDFQKVDVYATLNYHYKDRFGKDKLYVVRVRLTNAEIADDYKPSDATITANAPYINDLFKNCTWKVTDTTLVTKTESRAEITADHSNATFDTLVDSVNGTTSKLDLPYDTLIQLTTDKVSGDKTFSYWMQYDLDSDGSVVADSGEIFSYNREVSVRVTFNRKFVAVYGESRDLFTTNIQDAVYTREQSTNADGTVKYDYVYSDFLTQFETSIAGKTFADVAKNGDTKSGVKNVRFGIITEYDYNQTAYTGGDLTSYKSQAKKDTVTSTIITLDSNKKDSLASGWSNSTVKEDAEYNYYYNLYDLSGSVDDLTDLGRKDFFFKFENTAENQGKVYNVYSYVIYEDATGTHVVLSTPKFMSIYATGTTNTPVVG
ncbi:MAG: hypothetical protein ACI4W1_08400 [Ruminococcus sp.]